MSQDKHVWSIFIRFFHWTLVIAFIIAFLSGENEFDQVHTWSGYYIAILVSLRILWGFIGKGHTAFSEFVFGFSYISNYCKLLILGKAPRYLGHNPLGGLMVVLLLLLLSIVVITGLASYGIEEYAGPLYFLADLPIADVIGDLTEELHEITSYLLLPVIALHILGVLFSSLYHKENLVKAMFTGKKKIDKSDNQ